MSNLNKLIVILGPTASGKTELALKLAKKISAKGGPVSGRNGAEIISADSRQIFKDMNIGTAKPYAKNQKLQTKNQNYKLKTKKPYNLQPTTYNLVSGISHYLIDILSPDEKFSVAEYKELAVRIIRDVQNRGKVPIMVGGAGLYISAITDNIEIPKVKPNPALRKKLEKTSPVILLKRLKKLDPNTFKTIDKKNIRRIIRALEVTISTGIPFSAQRAKGAPLFDCLQIGLSMPREKLYKKIDVRVEKMIKSGLIQETKKLAKIHSWKLPSMSGIGYKEIGMYLRGEITLKRAKELIKFATHSYARRQMTWFRRDERIEWVKLDNKKGFNRIVRICKSFLTKSKV
ncbi:tRNA (adenosine(37)-N6)-dimethylallyltransferase MiaA [Patescibacteria group bacterium]|nr:tRNA (adenosine(37)-N6)-dimethylallyltransferase MiaA [Patescibacteria group bacterium]